MVSLNVLALLAASASAATSVPQSDRWRPEIEEASLRFGVPEAWIQAVIGAESGGRTLLSGRPITSPSGAMGLMQLMPATWAEISTALGLGRNPYDPHDNIIAGTAYLRAMYDRFGYPGMFAAYNSGPARYSAYLADGRPLPSETRSYVQKLAGTLHKESAARGEPGINAARPLEGTGSLFAIRHVSSKQTSGDRVIGIASGLFVIHAQPRPPSATFGAKGV